MTDEVGVIISAQTYGETLAANQIAYLKSDGKWWKAKADATATSTGEIGLVLDAGTSGRILKLGYRENASWTWTPGAPVYLSAATAGALTQTRPTGAGTVVRVIGYPASATVLYIDPGTPLALATVEGLEAVAGDIIVGDTGAWTKIAAGDAGAVVSSNGAGNLPIWERLRQVDLVDLVRRHNEQQGQIFYRILGDRNLEIAIPFRGNRAAKHIITKSPEDDYMRLAQAYVGEVTALDQTAPDSITGTITSANPPRSYASEVGSTVTATVRGTQITFAHYADNRGGIWEFVADGDTENAVQISTWDELGVTDQVTPLWGDLALGEHSIVGTFLGDDPVHVPSSGVGTGRGWINYDPGDPTVTAFAGHDPTLSGGSTGFVSAFQIRPYSNCEYAMGVSPDGTAIPGQWIPSHGLGTVFAGAQAVLVDGVAITDWTPQDSFTQARTIQVSQTDMEAINPGAPETVLALINTLHTFSDQGIAVRVRIAWQADTYIVAGYGMMFPVSRPYSTQLVTSYGNRYEAVSQDGSGTSLAEDDRAISYAFLNHGGVNGEPDIVAALTVEDPYRAYRQGQANRGESVGSVVWLEHRSTMSMQKLYAQVYGETTALTGEIYEWGGIYYVGELLNADKMLPGQSV